MSLGIIFKPKYYETLIGFIAMEIEKDLMPNNSFYVFWWILQSFPN